MFHDSGVKKADDQFEILLIEDNLGDVKLIEEALKEVDQNLKLRVVYDGVQAMHYLKKEREFFAAPTPSLIFLDINVPKRDGRMVLKDIKSDPVLRSIPVIILTVSQAENDIIQCYNLFANCYIEKPFEMERLVDVMKAIKLFWFNVATLPSKRKK